MEFSTPATQRSSSSEALAIKPGSVRNPAADAANDFARHLAENASQRSDRHEDRPIERRERSSTPDRAEKREEDSRTREVSTEARRKGEPTSAENAASGNTEAMAEDSISTGRDAAAQNASTGEEEAGPADKASAAGDTDGTQVKDDAPADDGTETVVAAPVPTEAAPVQTAIKTVSSDPVTKAVTDTPQQQNATAAPAENAEQSTAAPTDMETDADLETAEAQAKKPLSKQNSAQAAGVQAQAADRDTSEVVPPKTEAKEPVATKAEKGLGQEAAEKLAEKKSEGKQASSQSNATVTPASAQHSTRNGVPSQQAAQSVSASGSPATTNGDQPLSSVQQSNGSGNTTTVRIGTLPGQSQPTQLPANTIALQMARNLQKGSNRFDIRLDPPEMGRIDVRMEVRKDGHVVAHMSVDRPETLDLLQRDARALQQALNNAGLQADSDSLNFSLRDQNGDGGTRDFAGNGGGSGMAGDDTDIETPLAPVYNINLAANGGVDIRI